MKVKALIQNHYSERIPNIELMVDSLISNGVKPEDITILVDHDVKFSTKAKIMESTHPMPINWWHGIASVLDCDYIALLCDDLTLKPNSINSLINYASEYDIIDVFGYEGGKFTNPDSPYSGSEPSHTTTGMVEIAHYLIRFYFGKPKVFTRPLSLSHELPKDLRGHDDLILSLANKCAIVPTTQDSGWEDLPEYGVGVSKKSTHYEERDQVVNFVKELWNKSV